MIARSARLIFVNEFRLLWSDPVSIFMLILAPVVIIAVAGASLGNIYTSSVADERYLLPVVNFDQGNIAAALIDGLKASGSVEIVATRDRGQARKIIAQHDRAPIALVIPAGTTTTLERGGVAAVELYIDPVKRLEVNQLELQLDRLCEQITRRAQSDARRTMASRQTAVRKQLDDLRGQVKSVAKLIDQYRREAATAQKRAIASLNTQSRRAIESLRRQIGSQVDKLAAQNQAISESIAARTDALLAVKRYLDQLQISKGAFEQWLARLNAEAASHGVTIPAPPSFPDPPDDQQLAELSRPLQLAMPAITIEIPTPPQVSLRLPTFPRVVLPNLDQEQNRRPSFASLPGNITWKESTQSALPVRVNAFDQYVPGFGITFLLIGMLMGIGMGLIDERDWGTLQRLQVSGAPMGGVVIGKLLARSVVGIAQMVVLFAVGRLLFGISLGRNPAMLLAPTAAIALAAASVSLLTACIARTHDSVMPVGATIAMAMSAIGGCWWPLDFEPAWLRSIAYWMPTTWTMRAYNDLIIRQLPAADAVTPTLIVMGLTVLYLAIGIPVASKLYQSPITGA